MTAIADLTFEQQDEFSRKPIAEKVIRLLTSDIKVSPLVIDGGWGTGKTYFCHKLINLINETCSEQYRTVYVDAFKADHADEPLMTLLAAILSLLPEPEKKTLREKALPALRVGLKTSLKAAVGWVLKQDAADVVENFEDELKDASNEVIDSTIESLLKDHEKAEQSIHSLRAVLQELTKEKKIIVFVDELDRCRPDFAVAMLENIKHIFDVEGVLFSLITNSTQLRASIRNHYGDFIDAQLYLEKFVGFRFSLNKYQLSSRKEELISYSHFINSIENSEDTCFSFLKDKKILRLTKFLLESNNISLRETEKLLKYIRIYEVLDINTTYKKEFYIHKALKFIGIFIYTCNLKLSKKINQRNIFFNDLINLLGHNSLPSISDYLGDELDNESSEIAAFLFIEGNYEEIGYDLEYQQWHDQLYKYLKFNHVDPLFFIRKIISTLSLSS